MRKNNTNNTLFNEHDRTEDIIKMFEERTREKQAERNNRGQRMPEEPFCQDAAGIEPITDDKPRRNRAKSAPTSITKTESLVMWGLLVLLIVICVVTMQSSLLKINSELSDRVDNLEYQMMGLRADNVILAEKLESLTNNSSQRPINITVNVDGISENFEYDENGNLINPDQSDNNQDSSNNDEFDTRPFLGIAFYEDNTGDNNPLGLRIDYVYEYSPAAFAGIRPGDILISIDETAIKTWDDLNAIMSTHLAGDTIELQLATTSENGVDFVTVQVTLTYRGNFDLDGQN